MEKVEGMADPPDPASPETAPQNNVQGPVQEVPLEAILPRKDEFVVVYGIHGFAASTPMYE